MKSWIFGLSLMLSLGLFGQNCSTYYPFEEGTVTEYESLNAKGKVQGKMKYTVSGVSKSGGTTTATVTTDLYDKKGELVMNNEFEMLCTGSSVSIDFKSLMNNPGMEQFQNAEAKVTGNNLDIPNALVPGQVLPDANVEIAVDMGGMNMNISTQITDRKVEATETITTPAGTFDCVIVSQSSQTKMMVANVEAVEKTWLAKGVGMVKTESYNAKGKLMGTTLLTSVKK